MSDKKVTDPAIKNTKLKLPETGGQQLEELPGSALDEANGGQLTMLSHAGEGSITWKPDPQ